VKPKPPDYRKMPLGVRWHFLDSGAFTLKTEAAKYAEKTGKSEWTYYDTKAHWKYVDAYCRFVKDHWQSIDYFANVDAIPNPVLTWRNQKYIEDAHGIEPVPVVHYRTDLSWLHHYVRRGYRYIGVGGLVGEAGSEECGRWLDSLFNLVCATPDRTPSVRLHAFGLTSVELMHRYPWYSVDSASWTKIASYGGILVPHRRKGEWDFTITPYVMKVADESPDRHRAGYHFHALPKREQQLIEDWLEHIGVPFGSDTHAGVINSHLIRKDACILFFELMKLSIPPYPWPFKRLVLKGLP
jgi:hypothetical protein